MPRYPSTTPTLFIIGGAEDRVGKASLLRQFLKLAGGRRARLVLIPTASSFQDEVVASYTEVFTRLGAPGVAVVNPATRAESHDPDLVALVDGATGIFMSGGSQLRLSQLLPGTPLGEALHRAHDRGAVIGGTSAGASIMSDFMISMGEEGVTPRQRASQISAGLGLVRGVVVDQHFDQRSRYGRLMSVIAPSPHLLGIGIDEDTAIVVTDAPRVHRARHRRGLRRRLHDRRHRRRGRPRRCPDARVRRHRAHPARGRHLRPRRAAAHRLRRAAPRPARLGRRRQGLTAHAPVRHARPPTATRGEAPMDRPTPTGPAAPDLRIVESRVYRGGNIWSYDPSIHLVVDLGVLEDYPTDTLPGFTDRLVELLPGLENHTCSKGVQGGFVERLREGTWLGHVSEHVALQLQQEAGHDQRRGKTRQVKGSTGVYNVIYGYTNEEVGLAAGRLAVRLLNHLVQEEEGFDFAAELETFLTRAERTAFGPSTGGHPRGGGQPRHPLHPAQQRQPGAARPGRAPAADPRHDDRRRPARWPSTSPATRT